ncbi:metallophosphoesterase [Candidatus Gracilibacteria bacterium]|nr:metallophosphoesterase [Candidatus Gracilibacteria bacterium]
MFPHESSLEHIIFDIIIIGFLLLDGLVIYRLISRRARHTNKKRKPWYKGALVLAVIAWLTVFYGSYIEPQIILVNRQTINLTEKPTHTITIALISDTHVGPFKRDRFMQRAVDKINSLHADAIVLDGDFISFQASETKYLEPLKNLQAKLGVYGTLGNHDYGVDAEGNFSNNDMANSVRDSLVSLGVNVLRNQGVVLENNGSSLRLIGTDEIQTGRASIRGALGSVGSSTTARYPTILLAHNPDTATYAQKYGIDLVLAGHTHGGQVRLPFIGPVPPLPQHLPRKYDRGLFSSDFGKTQLFITSGIGESGARARLFVPPEIALLTINY